MAKCQACGAFMKGSVCECGFAASFHKGEEANKSNDASSGYWKGWAKEEKTESTEAWLSWIKVRYPEHYERCKANVSK